jgi:hypothetical protein
MGWSARFRSLLAHERLPLALASAVALLLGPSVGTGFVLDDYVLRAVSLGRAGEVGVPGSRFDLFTFFSDAPGEHLRETDAGWAPWWAGADLRVRFFRPLSSFTHWLDFQVWGSSPLPMHLENVALYAAVVLAVALFYRRFLGPTWASGLAAVLYAIDPGHAQSAGFVAGRNTVLAPLFGVLALIAYDRAQREGRRAFIPLSAALFAAALLAGESGVSAGLYLVAYAVCLDPEASWARRLRALGPHALVGLAWVVAYKLLRYGARGSTMYVDPGHDPLVFLRAVLVRAPIYLAAQLGLPPASTFSALSVRAVAGLAGFGVLFAALFARLAWPLLRDDRVARFFALGMLLSVLPVCAITPNDRVLFFVGLGGLGLVARFTAVVLGGPTPATRARRALAWFFVVVHGPLALALFVFYSRVAALLAGSSREPLDEIVLDPGQTVLFVNAPAQFMVSHLAVMRLGTAKPLPARTRCLAPGVYPLEVTRADARSLMVRVPGGLLQPPGTWDVDGEERSPAVSTAYGAQQFAQLVRRVDDPMRAGDTIALTGVTIEVREATADGRPVTVRFTFDEPLESPSLRWLVWDRGRYVDFPLPAIGTTVKLAPASMMGS